MAAWTSRAAVAEADVREGVDILPRQVYYGQKLSSRIESSQKMANKGDGRFGDTIRILRKRRGEPLRVVAAAIDVDSTLLSKIERGDRLPTNEQVAKLAVYFGVPADDLAAQAIAEKIVLDYGNERATLRAVNIVRERLARYGGE